MVFRIQVSLLEYMENMYSRTPVHSHARKMLLGVWTISNNIIIFEKMKEDTTRSKSSSLILLRRVQTVQRPACMSCLLIVIFHHILSIARHAFRTVNNSNGRTTTSNHLRFRFRVRGKICDRCAFSSFSHVYVIEYLMSMYILESRFGRR